jgi:antitoxin component YwqK of YwqJK toxin-antitoxin module
MKWIIYILLFFATVACSDSVIVTEDEIGAEVFYEKDSYQPFTGRCIVVYRNTDIVKEEFTFKKGLLHGEALTWYKNGQIRRKGFYQKGQISGKWEFWEENGQKTIEANYTDDILNGSYIALYSNGKIKEKGQFSDNRPIGKWVYFNEEGQVIKSDRK